MKNIILVGFMGSGKSTVGQALSRRLGVPFFEMDAEIERLSGKKIPEIFKDFGEEKFREWEYLTLREALKQEGVTATGGGVISTDNSLSVLKEANNVVYLKGRFSTLLTHINEDTQNIRPLAEGKQKQHLESLFHSRLEKYEEVANISVPIDDLSIEEIVENILIQMEALNQ